MEEHHWVYTHPYLGVCIDPEIEPTEAGYDTVEDVWVVGAGVPNLRGYWSKWPDAELAASSKRTEVDLSPARRLIREHPYDQARNFPRRILIDNDASRLVG